MDAHNRREVHAPLGYARVAHYIGAPGDTFATQVQVYIRARSMDRLPDVRSLPES